VLIPSTKDKGTGHAPVVQEFELTLGVPVGGSLVKALCEASGSTIASCEQGSINSPREGDRSALTYPTGLDTERHVDVTDVTL